MRPSSPSVAAKYRDAAFLLPLAGLFLLMPPLIGLVAIRGPLFGIPAIVAYVFGLWTALIVISFWFSHRLSDPEHHAPPPPDISTPGR